MWDLRDDDPQPRPPMRDRSGEGVPDEMAEQLAAHFAAELKRTRGKGRVAEPVTEYVQPVTPSGSLQVIPPEPPVSETVRTIRRVAAGGKYVSVEKLIEALDQ